MAEKGKAGSPKKEEERRFDFHKKEKAVNGNPEKERRFDFAKTEKDGRRE